MVRDEQVRVNVVTLRKRSEEITRKRNEENTAATGAREKIM